MPDAIPATDIIDKVVALDLYDLHFLPPFLSIQYQLKQTWQSGRVEILPVVQLRQEDYRPAIDALRDPTQQNAIASFLSFCVQRGYQTNLIVSPPPPPPEDSVAPPPTP